MSGRAVAAWLATVAVGVAAVFTLGSIQAGHVRDITECMRGERAAGARVPAVELAESCAHR